jgi:hypothetical protein
LNEINFAIYIISPANTPAQWSVMRLRATVLTVALLIALVLASGCADVSFGQNKIGDFGNTKEELAAVDFFIKTHGDPQITSGPPRFLEPVVSTGLINKTPVDSVIRLNKGTDRIYFWVFYDNFQKGDPLTINWVYNGKTAGSVQNVASGKFGRVYGEFIKPDTGWPPGTHEITIVGKGTQASTKFEIVDGTTDKATPPFLKVVGLNWLNPQPEPPAPAKLAVNQVENQTTSFGSQCPSGSYACGNACSQLQYDEQNCGACNYHCQEGQTCQNGQCVGSQQTVSCPEGQLPCVYSPGAGYLCTNVGWDNTNCGTCGVVCGAGTTCQNGQCLASVTTSCPTGQKKCGTGCVNILSDYSNCGDCGQICSPGFGTCCNGQCPNTWTDPSNCGSCGHVCLQGQTCINGQCFQTCASGTTSCSGICVTTQTDSNNCGYCGNKCSSIQYCSNGVCTATGGGIVKKTDLYLPTTTPPAYWRVK